MEEAQYFGKEMKFGKNLLKVYNIKIIKTHILYISNHVKYVNKCMNTDFVVLFRLSTRKFYGERTNRYN